jgi:predicted ATP-binding protein involved in virulence
MKITQLKINDFRGFRELLVNFPKSSNIVVFIGINGAGKSAILDAIGILLNILIDDICSLKKSKISPRNYFNSDDVNLNSQEYSLQLDFCFRNALKTNNKVKSSIVLCTISLVGERILSGIYDEFKHKILSSEPESLNIPVLVYYSTSRTILDNKKSTSKSTAIKYEYTQFFAYENAFNYNISSFSDFFKWFREEEDLENQEQIRLKDFNYRNKRLQIVRNAIDRFLNKFGFAIFTNLRVQRERTSSKRNNPNEEAITSSLIILKDGQKFKFSQLSSGEKMMLSLVVDIARRLAIANPSLENKLEGEGIVLIDEIDLHLHPQWQRKLLPALTHTFPNIQFIVTTHSPQVLSHLPRESVFLLEDNKISDREIYTEGRDSNSILLDAFHVPEVDKEYEVEIKEIYDLISNYDAENAQQKLEKLKEKRGEYDREIMRMQSYIDIL